MNGGLRSCRAKMRSQWNQERPSRRIRRCRPVGNETNWHDCNGSKIAIALNGTRIYLEIQSFHLRPDKGHELVFRASTNQKTTVNAKTRT